MAKIWPSELKETTSADVGKFIIDFKGAFARTPVNNEDRDCSLRCSEYRLTTPLSAPTAKFVFEAAKEDVIVPSPLENRSMHWRLLTSHL